MSYPKLTTSPIRFDLETPAGDRHTNVTLLTVKAIAYEGARLYLNGEHVYTFSARDLNSGSGLFWGYNTGLLPDRLDAWKVDGNAFNCAIHPGQTVPEGDYTIAQYGGVVAFGRAAVRSLLAERNEKHGSPKPKPQLYLHLFFVSPRIGRPAKHKLFPLTWGETAPKDALDFVLENVMAGRHLARAMISTSHDPCGAVTYRETMVGCLEVEKLLRGAKIDEVWPCK